MLTPDMILQNRYRIEKPLAQGGMGAVYKATDLRLGCTVALKETFFQDERLRRAFEREARILAGLFHPGLPKVSDHFNEGDGQFLIMEFVPGKDLGDLLAEQGKPFPAERVVEWADQILEILEYLHTQDPPIIHRDIKPANLKLTPEGKIILIDFGMARSTESSIAGYSMSYAPPEQIDQIRTDGRSDLYALGATMYHLTTAAPPPSAVTRVMATAGQEGDPLRPPRDLCPSIPDAVSNLIVQTMAIDRERRPQTATAMRQALKQAMSQAVEIQAAQTRIDAPATRPPVGPTVAVAGATAAASVPCLMGGSAPTAVAPAGFAPTVAALPRAVPQVQAQPVFPAPPTSPLVQNGPPPLPVGFPAESRAVHRSKPKTGLVVVLGLIVLTGALLGIWFWKSKGSEKTGESAAKRAQVLQYHLELQDGTNTKQVSGDDPLGTRKPFKFHLKPEFDGYLYIVAPGDGNVLMTFLTDKPSPESGVADNKLTTGKEYSFPEGSDNWIGLRDDTYATVFTLIVSKKRLTEPAFLHSEAGKRLTPAEQKDFESFRGKYVNADLKREPNDKKNASVLTLPKELDAEAPLVFDVTVRRK